MAEVYVDVETGQVYVLNLKTAHDVATILNPIAHQGQIDGGIVQDLGYVLMEELMVEDGRVTTLNLGELRYPLHSTARNRRERYFSGRACNRQRGV